MFRHSAHLYDAIYGYKDYATESRVLRELIERHKRSGGNALLDVACGTGAHLAHLREWYAVQGVEVDRDMLDIARAKLPDVPLHVGDMADFGLGKRFDAVTCLFSSVGYLQTVERLRHAVRAMAAHLLPGGVLAVEPWFFPERFVDGSVHASFVDQPGLKVARMGVSRVEGRLSVMDMHYLVARDGAVERFDEHHVLGLFTEDEYAEAFRSAGLEVSFDSAGLTGRGLFVGVAPAGAAPSAGRLLRTWTRARFLRTGPALGRPRGSRSAA